MKFYQLYPTTESLRADGEEWTLMASPELNDLRDKHTSGIPQQADFDRFVFGLWSDCPLGDALNQGFYDCYLISERLKRLLDGMKLPAEQVFFYRTSVLWRGKKYPYYWLQTIDPADPDACYDFPKCRFHFFNEDKRPVQVKSMKELDEKSGYDEVDFAKSEVYLNANAVDYDLFRMPGKSLGRGLFVSERLKGLMEQEGITGLGFLESDGYLHVSSLRKTPRPSSPPKVFSITLRKPYEYPAPKPPKPLGMVEAWLQTLFDAAQLRPDDRMALLGLTANATRLAFEHVMMPPNKEAPPSRSRFMGKPFLPKGFAWPRTKEGKPLLFVGQLNLAEVPNNNDLPPSGLLFFFLDVYGSSTIGFPLEDDRHHVAYFENAEGFWLMDFPDDLPLNVDFEEYQLNFVPKYDLPDDRWSELFSEEEQPLQEIYDAFINELDSGLLPWMPKLLGWPRSLQGYPGLELAINWEWEKFEGNETHYKREALKWRLLLQFEAGHAGLEAQLTDPYLFFMIHEDDLKKRDFSKTKLVMQIT